MQRDPSKPNIQTRDRLLRIESAINKKEISQKRNESQKQQLFAKIISLVSGSQFNVKIVEFTSGGTAREISEQFPMNCPQLAFTGQEWIGRIVPISFHANELMPHVVPYEREIEIGIFDYAPIALTSSGVDQTHEVSINASTSKKSKNAEAFGLGGTNNSIFLNEGGLYDFRFPFQFKAEDYRRDTGFAEISITDDSSNVKNFSNYKPGILKAELIVWDTNGTIGNGTVIDVWESYADSRLGIITGANPRVIEVNSDHPGMLQGAFGISQSTIDACLGECRLSILFTFQKPANLSAGAVTGEVRCNHNVNVDDGEFSNLIRYYDEPCFDTADEIAVTPATPPP